MSNSNDLSTKSVVPELMKVYESLTQSKTPQISLPPLSDQKKADEFHQPMADSSADSSFIQGIAAMSPPPTTSINTSDNLTTIAPNTSTASNDTNGKRPRRSTSSRKRLSNDSTDSSKARKKKAGDGRWTKRFAWPDELHRSFVAAVFDVGLKNSSPSAILEHMNPDNSQVTTERIKSHLQKYRLHRQKSKKEFMQSYESSYEKLKNDNDSAANVDYSSLDCGEIAAHLAYSTKNERDILPDVDPKSLIQDGVFTVPTLTKDEMESPLGSSLGYLMGLFLSLKQQLESQRKFTHPHIDPAGSSSMQPVDTGITPSCSPSPPHNVTHVPSQYTGASEPLVHQHVNAGHPRPIHSQTIYQPNSSTEPPIPSLASHAASDIGNSNSVPSQDQGTRTTTFMEESNMMKRDMQSQMVFQNKMRQLKDQEMRKYTTMAQGTTATTDTNINSISNVQLAGQEEVFIPQNTSAVTAHDTDLSGVDIWGEDEIMDEQLFSFLMND